MKRSKVVTVDGQGQEIVDGAGNIMYEGEVSAEITKWQKYISLPADVLVANTKQPVRAGKNKGSKHCGSLQVDEPVLVCERWTEIGNPARGEVYKEQVTSLF